MPLGIVVGCIFSESAPEPRSLPHGGPVVLRRIRVRGRFFAVLDVSRVVSGRAANAWEISMTVATLNSRCAIAETGKWYEGQGPANRCVGASETYAVRYA